MKIAIIGSRGIPARYGGFETCAERLAIGLKELGHEIVVYGLSESSKESGLYKGVKYYNFKAPKKKSFQKPILALKSVIHCLREKADVVLFLGVSAAPFSLLCRMSKMKTVINLDGLEWKRGKWGKLGRFYLRLSEGIAVRSCHSVIGDSKALIDIYKDLYGVESIYIPYGADVVDSVPFDSLKRYGLKPEGYILQSCRLEPENNVHFVLEAYHKSRKTLPLVILGDAPQGSRYKESLLKIAGKDVRFLGFIFGPDYRQIVAHAGLYIHAHEVGGTNPSLLEAMAVGQAPLYLDVPFNREVAGDVGFPFKKDMIELSSLMDELIGRITEVRKRAKLARNVIRQRYSWESVIDEYERVFLRLLKNSHV